MKTLTTALTVTAFILGAGAAQAMTAADAFTTAERSEIRRLVPEARLSGLSEKQVHELAAIVGSRDHANRAEARHEALAVIRERPWLLPAWR
ncbi:hypothetical protein [Pararhodobacter sp. SW119]|uniref:hypothetical protein n=1 Tax=Pararhodobacter sp. SW119 TaxID=2780075 RepID=UPI001ADEF831|nr:hypothetical protein [Pararhodobacter sp. SW119]